MANVKVFADKQTDALTNGRTKNYMPSILKWGLKNVAIRVNDFNFPRSLFANYIKVRVV